MKIGFVVESFPTEDEMSGGVRVSVRKQADFLSQQNELVVFAARKVFPPLTRYSQMAGRAEGSRSFRRMEGKLRIYGPPCIHVPLLWKFLEPLQLAAWMVFVYAVLERGTALIHAHRCFPVGFAAAVAALLLGRPLVVTVYGSDVNFGLDRVEVGSWVSSATRFALRRASRVIAVSRALTERMRASGLDGDKMRVVASGADSSLSASAGKNEARETLGLPTDGKMVLMASNLVEVKDPLTMLRAFSIVRRDEKKALLVILGEGRLEGLLRSEIDRLEMSDSVRLKRRRPREEMPLWISASDVVSLSSRDEGCPVIALEAFISGRPFVGTAVGGVPEIVPDETVGLLVEPSNPEALAEALSVAFRRHWDRQKLVRHGLQFSWENLSKRIEAVYGEVRSERKGQDFGGATQADTSTSGP